MSRVFNQSTSNFLSATIGIAAARANYTIIAWAKPDAAFTGGVQPILVMNNAFNKPRLALWNADNSPCNAIASSADAADDGAPESTSTGTPVTKGAWNFLALVVNGSSVIVRVGTTDYTNTATTESITTAVSTLRIGAGDLVDALGGKVAHVACWKRALSTGELDALAGGANPSAQSAANRWFYYPLTDASLGNVWTPTDGDTAGALTVNGTVASDAGDNPTVTGGGGGSAAAAAHYYRRRRAA
jgi:hypothetical protein